MPRLEELAATVDGSKVIGSGNPVIIDATHDSRTVKPGSLFMAIRGSAADGHDFIPQAVASGAAAVCVDHRVESDLPQLQVPSTRAALGPLSAAVWGHPSRNFRLVGVTGTNGKTTVTHMIEAITTAAGQRTGLIGTIGARVIGGSTHEAIRIPLVRTTPEATDLQRLFAEMAVAGADVVAMEVSSHALSLGRVAGTEFAIGAFTNLSQDHLDFHQTMEDYFAAKASLFDSVPIAVVQADNAWGRRLIERLPETTTIMSVGDGGEVTATGVTLHVDHSTFTLNLDSGSLPVRLPIAGRFNIDNALVAAGCARQLRISLDVIVRGLSALLPVPGRFELVQSESGLDVVVDYAHTPDGVENAVAAGRAMTAGRLIVVIGAGGDRDQAKRPRMGAAAAAADWVFVTSDNPRSERPDDIIAQVVDGIDDASCVTVEPDRRRAISAAVGLARPGDLVMILGKGHEQGQDIGGVIYPFDDRTVAREAMGIAR
jgi:UDP-N-acetylmuramoyl-L-alanyl-D-glutamate--2,6-diaminopimelate ligase